MLISVCNRFRESCLKTRATALCRACEKTLSKKLDQKIDCIERPTSDDHHLANGFDTPNCSASPLDFEFLHWACLLPSYKAAVQLRRGVGCVG